MAGKVVGQRRRVRGRRPGDQAWVDLLYRLGEKVLAGRDRAAELSEEAAETGWLGAEGAGARELAALEDRLGRPLPPTYRAFLETTDGWGPTSSSVDRLYPAREVAWFAESEPQWVEMWAENEEGPALRGAVQVSSVADGVVLLIPWDRAEWECWFFASWIPGARPHPFMEGELKQP